MNKAWDKKNEFFVWLFLIQHEQTLAIPLSLFSSLSTEISRPSPHESHHNELKLPFSLATLERRPEPEQNKRIIYL